MTQPALFCEASNFLVGAIKDISRAVEIIMGEDLADDGNGVYQGEVFFLKSFSVDEDGATLFRFQLDNESEPIEVTWWQHVGRGTFVNREVSPNEVLQMLWACLDEVLAVVYEQSFKTESDG